MDPRRILMARRDVLIIEIERLREQLRAFDDLEAFDQTLRHIERAYFSPQSPIEQVLAICRLIASDGRVFRNKDVKLYCAEHKHLHTLLKKLAAEGQLEDMGWGKWRYIGGIHDR